MVSKFKESCFFSQLKIVVIGLVLLLAQAIVVAELATTENPH
jgi:hypothetical protein